MDATPWSEFCLNQIPMERCTHYTEDKKQHHMVFDDVPSMVWSREEANRVHERSFARDDNQWLNSSSIRHIHMSPSGFHAILSHLREFFSISMRKMAYPE